jgi:hypothetical protein
MLGNVAVCGAGPHNGGGHITRTVSWLASDLPFLGRLLAIVMSSAASLWKIFRDQAERGSGIGLKMFSFIAESVFTIIPESCSGSSWNSVAQDQRSSSIEI